MSGTTSWPQAQTDAAAPDSQAADPQAADPRATLWRFAARARRLRVVRAVAVGLLVAAVGVVAAAAYDHLGHPSFGQRLAAAGGGVRRGGPGRVVGRSGLGRSGLGRSANANELAGGQ